MKNENDPFLKVVLENIFLGEKSYKLKPKTKTTEISKYKHGYYQQRRYRQ